MNDLCAKLSKLIRMESIWCWNVQVTYEIKLRSKKQYVRKRNTFRIWITRRWIKSIGLKSNRSPRIFWKRKISSVTCKYLISYCFMHDLCFLICARNQVPTKRDQNLAGIRTLVLGRKSGRSTLTCLQLHVFFVASTADYCADPGTVVRRMIAAPEWLHHESSTRPQPALCLQHPEVNCRSFLLLRNSSEPDWKKKNSENKKKKNWKRRRKKTLNVISLC